MTTNDGAEWQHGPRQAIADQVSAAAVGERGERDAPAHAAQPEARHHRGHHRVRLPEVLRETRGDAVILHCRWLSLTDIPWYFTL